MSPPAGKEWWAWAPRRLRLPYGYEVVFSLVSQAYMDKLAGAGRYAVSFDFGDRIPGRTPGPPRRAHIFFSREMNNELFADKIQHEMHHTLTEWGGYVFNSIVVDKERP